MRDHQIAGYLYVVLAMWLILRSTSLWTASSKCCGLGILCMWSIVSSVEDSSGNSMENIELAYLCSSAGGCSGMPRT